jgi:hypothetical protein
MDEQFDGMPEDIAERGLQYTKDQFAYLLSETEDFVRENPARALGYALAAGFILNRLPLGRILGGVVRLALVAFKPAILMYGATRIYQAAQTQRQD